MITRSGIDAPTGSIKTMDYNDKPRRKERYHERSRGTAETMVRAILALMFLATLVATSGCSTQSAASSGNQLTEELAGPGEFILTPEGRIVIIKKRDPESNR